MKKNYILDTNVLLTDHKSISSYGNNDVIIPLKVLDEIDNHKKRQDGVGLNARAVIRTLDKLRSKGSLHKGVRIAPKKGIVSVSGFDAFDMPEDLDYGDADNNIVATAISVSKRNPKRKVVVVTRDINMRVKCDALGLLTEDYISSQVVKHHENLYTGFVKHLVDDEVVDQFYSGEDVYVEKEDVTLYPNHMVMLISNSNEKKTALAKFDNYNHPLAKLKEFKSGPWGLKPRNKEQKFALNLLMDPSIPVVSLVGKAGSGKTLMAIAAGLQQVLDDETAIYKKLVVSRPIQPMGKDIGFLPGTLEEKMNPWLAPIQDNLEWLMGDKSGLEMYVDRGVIQIEALTYIRGRSIADAFIVIDEAQNLTHHELKTIMTRVGENTKLVLTGDVQQIDNVYLDGTNNGLSYAVEKFKVHELSGHITLFKGERSKVATLAADIL